MAKRKINPPVHESEIPVWREQMSRFMDELFFRSNLPVYADNASAIAGGLIAGQFYRTATGVVMVVY